MDITVKISELPSEVNTNEQGIKEFYVKANEREVFIAINSKQYNKLVTAQQTWPSWIGRIEKTYFKLLGEWDKNYFQLVAKVAKELEMNEKAVATWLGFLHQPHGVIRRIALPSQEVIEQVIKLYQEYLEGEEPPKLGLHSWISQNMTDPLDINTIHKVLADYREKLKKNKFGSRPKPKPKQLLLDAVTENNDKVNDNETIDNDRH